VSRFRSAVAWLLPACAILLSSGWIGLIEPTETRYAEIAREVLAGGDWLTPTLNGIPHFHKPPLAYWISAGGMALLGTNEWGARLGVALAAAFVLWCTARIGHQAGGALAPVFLATSLLFFVVAHQLGSDIFLAAAVAGYYAAMIDPRARRSVWPFVALGLGFMAKGPVVLVLTVVPTLLAAAWARDGSTARALANWRGWALFAAIALPWYIVVVLKTPGLLGYFLKHQLWERYTTTVHQRSGPLYYFLVVVLAGALPWTWAALRAGAHAAKEAGRRNVVDALLVSWVVLPIVFFSFSGSKLPAYVLPIFPALAVLASRWPAPERKGQWLRVAAVTFAVQLALLAAVAPLDSQLGSPSALAQKLKESRGPGEPVVEYGVFNAGIPFYLRETVPMLEVPRDPRFASPEVRSRAILTRRQFALKVRTAGRGWVVGDGLAVERMAIPLGFNATRMAGSGKQTLVLLEWAR
jgi:4-amino-4-deoxy-L-arabinose transferase-like glycosyltransferase